MKKYIKKRKGADRIITHGYGELLELYNAMGQTHEKDLSKLHLKIEGDGAYIWMDGLHTYFIKL